MLAAALGLGEGEAKKAEGGARQRAIERARRRPRRVEEEAPAEAKPKLEEVPIGEDGAQEPTPEPSMPELSGPEQAEPEESQWVPPGSGARRPSRTTSRR